MPKISVIVPIYNSAQYLSACIESILSQTYHDFELLLIDDGSTDSSGIICREYASLDQRVRYIPKENGGVSTARNCGIQNANGEFIAFVDSDDVLKEDMLATLVKSGSDFSMCGYELYDDASNTVSVVLSCDRLCGTLKDLAQNICSYISPPFLLGPCFKLFNRIIVIDNDVSFPPELSYGEDAIFVFEYLIHCKTVDMFPYIGYSYRKHGKTTLSGRFLLEKIDINYRINILIDTLLRQENIVERQQILSERMLECFVSYTKELMNTNLAYREKKNLFYEKYANYKREFGGPSRMAQRLVLMAGKCRVLYPLVYLFKTKA